MMMNNDFEKQWASLKDNFVKAGVSESDFYKRQLETQLRLRALDEKEILDTVPGPDECRTQVSNLKVGDSVKMFSGFYTILSIEKVKVVKVDDKLLLRLEGYRGPSALFPDTVVTKKI